MWGRHDHYHHSFDQICKYWIPSFVTLIFCTKTGTKQYPEHYTHKYYYSRIQSHWLLSVTLHQCTVLCANTEMYYVTLTQSYPHFLHIVWPSITPDEMKHLRWGFQNLLPSQITSNMQYERHTTQYTDLPSKCALKLPYSKCLKKGFLAWTCP